MSNIQKTLDSLQPYVHSIRFIKGSPVIDMVLPEGWTVLEDANIQKVKGDDGLNYHMIFSDKDGIGLDELLIYVEKTVKANLDREKKHDLLRIKVNELKEIFKKNSLSKLQLLKFSFGDEDLMPTLSDIDDYEEISPIVKKPAIVSAPIDEPYEEEIHEINQHPETYLDENKQPIQLSQEELELIEEEKRAEKNRKFLAAKKQTAPVNANSKKVELPPKRKVEMAVSQRDYETDCECGPTEACEKCIDKKDF